MIIDLTISNLDLINKLEKQFPYFFLSENQIINDIGYNVFSKYFIYVEESNIIGFVNYFDIYDRFEIANIFVEDIYRNKKIGSKMLEHLIMLGEKKNIKNITLEVKKDNFAAINLYKKYYFEIVAIRKQYYQGIDGLLMERKMM